MRVRTHGGWANRQRVSTIVFTREKLNKVFLCFWRDWNSGLGMWSPTLYHYWATPPPRHGTICSHCWRSTDFHSAFASSVLSAFALRQWTVVFPSFVLLCWCCWMVAPAAAAWLAIMQYWNFARLVHNYWFTVCHDNLCLYFFFSFLGRFL